MDTDKHDHFSPHDGELSRVVRAAIDEIRREEPEDAVVERVIVRALGIASSGTNPECVQPASRVARWKGRLMMRRRIVALGVVGAAAVLGLLLLWEGIATRPVSAMEKMAEKIRQAKSWKCTAIGKMTFTFKTNNPPKVVTTKREMRMTEYWRAPDSIRMESTSDTWNGPGPELTKIAPGGYKAWIMIDHRQKTFRFRTISEKDVAEMKSFSPDKLADFRGEADRELGTKEINGKKARGFAIGTKKINTSLPTPGLLEIWLDSETNLPILIRSEVKTENTSATEESSEIQWNVDLDPKLFDVTPPKGYRDSTPKAPASGDPVGHIIEALRTFARTPEGPYLSMQQHVGAEDIEGLLTLLDVMQGRLERGEYPVQAKTDSEEKKARAAKWAKDCLERHAKQREGFLHLRAIIHADRDVAYYGKTVGPKDKDKVLLRWKLDDGRYEVIFGDLRAETVTAERLHALEAK